MSDQGPHYKNQVVEGLRRYLGDRHQFSPAHCPWSNGTVEVMMRSLQKTCKMILAEMKSPQSETRSVLKVVQNALNIPQVRKSAGSYRLP
jgi:transposase InsO family protein